MIILFIIILFKALGVELAALPELSKIIVFAVFCFAAFLDMLVFSFVLSGIMEYKNDKSR